MNDIIPTTRRVIGEDLGKLRQQLGLSVADACALFGMWANKWSATTRSAGGQRPVASATLALLARALAQWPEASPLPTLPTPAEIYTLLRPHSVSMKQMAILFGYEASTGHRWLTEAPPVNAVTRRLFEVFRRLHQQAEQSAPATAALIVEQWQRMVVAEATERGLDADILTNGCWTATSHYPRHPVTGHEVNVTRKKLELSVPEACWLFGLSMNKWSEAVRQRAKDPVGNVSLALLVRALQANPQMAPLPRKVDPARFLATLCQQQPLSQRRFALLLGCEASAGSRWINQQVAPAPVVERLLSVWQQRLGDDPDGPSVQRGLAEWGTLIKAEMTARGTEDVFSAGRWPCPSREQLI